MGVRRTRGLCKRVSASHSLPAMGRDVMGGPEGNLWAVGPEYGFLLPKCNSDVRAAFGLP